MIVTIKLKYEDVEPMIDMYKSGIKVQDIAKKFNIKNGTVWQRLRKMGVTRTRRWRPTLSKEASDWILDMYRRGIKIPDIARELSIAKCTVYEYIPKDEPRLRQHRLSITDPVRIQRIIDEYKRGVPVNMIAFSYRVAPATIKKTLDVNGVLNGDREIKENLCVRCGKYVNRDDIRHQYRRLNIMVCNDCDRGVSFRPMKMIKEMVIEAYGGCCSCCGETAYEFLTIDHINKDGKKHRESLGSSTKTFYLYLRNNGYPKDRFRLMCMNCNWAIGIYGFCPHDTKFTFVGCGSSVRNVH